MRICDKRGRFVVQFRTMCRRCSSLPEPLRDWDPPLLKVIRGELPSPDELMAEVSFDDRESEVGDGELSDPAIRGHAREGELHLVRALGSDVLKVVPLSADVLIEPKDYVSTNLDAPVVEAFFGAPVRRAVIDLLRFLYHTHSQATIG